MYKISPFVYKKENEFGELIILNVIESKIYKICEQGKNHINYCFDNPNIENKYRDFLVEKKVIVKENYYGENIHEELYNNFLYDTNFMHLVILPTEACNFRCIYCYEDYKKGRMSSEVQQGILNFVLKDISKYKALRVEWFGGEPLCASDIVNDLSRQLIKICKDNKKPYYASMTTNAYNLDLETFKIMSGRNHILKYQITIDGVRETHNKQRIFHNGDGTFDVIIKNLKDIRDNTKTKFVNFVLRTNITKNVGERFNEYVDLIEKEFGDDVRFELLWKIAWMPSEDCTVMQNTSNTIYCKQQDLKYYLKKYKNKVLRFGTNKSQFMNQGNICYASRKGSVVIGSDGTLYKCTVAFKKEKNVVGKLEANGEMVLNDNFKYWTERRIDIPDKCKNCFYYPACLGVYCNLNNIDRSGNLTCPGLKDYLDDFLDYISKYNYFIEDVNLEI